MNVTHVTGVLFVVVLVLLVWWLWPERSIEVVNNPPKNSTIVAFGDSLVEGVGASKGGDFVSVLSRRLGMPIINLGVAGDTSKQGLRRVDEITDEDPGVVIILLGGNDAIQRKSSEEVATNLGAIIETVQEGGAVVVLLGVRSGIFGGSYGDMYEEVARTYGTVYVPDVLKGLFGKPEFMADTIHPNDKGYAIIADRVFEEMQPLFQ